MPELSDEQIEALQYVKNRLVREWVGRLISAELEEVARSYLRQFLYEAKARGEEIEPLDLRLDIDRVTGYVAIIPRVYVDKLPLPN